MDTLLVLPAKAKVIGLVMIGLGAAGALVATQNGLINVYRIVDPNTVAADGTYPYPPNFWSLNLALSYTAVTLLVGGLVGFVLAKEPDEFFYRARLEALHFALGAQLIIAFSLYGFFYWSGSHQMANTYLTILTSSFIGFGVFFMLHYYYHIFGSHSKSKRS